MEAKVYSCHVVSSDCAGAEVKSTETVGPVLIHIVTEKGRGYEPAETASDKMHGVGKYDPITGQQQKSKGGVSPQTCHSSLPHLNP